MSRWSQLIRESLRGEEVDYTKQPINRAIVLLAIPMILEMAGEGLFALVDAYFVSKISVEAVATIGLTESVITIIYSLAFGISMAATAMVSRRTGEKDHKGAALAAGQAIALAGILALVLGILGYIFAADVLRMMGGSPALIESGLGYTKVMFAFNAPIFFLFVMNGIFRGAGNAIMAMLALWVANVINIVLDPILIFGWGPIPAYGVAGAAIATTIGRSTAVLFQLYLLFGRGTGTWKLRFHNLIPSIRLQKKLLDLAAGGAGQFLIASASWVILMRLMTDFGEMAVAGYTIAIRILIFTILPSWGLSNAAATLVGQNLGANQPEKAAISAWRAAHFNAVFLLLVSIVVIIFAPSFIVFFDDSPEVVRVGTLALRTIFSVYVLFSYGMVLGQAINGAGDTRTPTLLNFICFWLMEIPLAYFLSHYFHFEEWGIFLAVAIAESSLAVLFIYIFYKGTWKTIQV